MDRTRYAPQAPAVARTSAALKVGALACSGAALALALAFAAGVQVADRMGVRWEALSEIGEEVHVVDFNLTADDCRRAVRALRATSCRPQAVRIR